MNPTQAADYSSKSPRLDPPASSRVFQSSHLLLTILLWLPPEPKSLAEASMVNKGWHDAIDSADEVWSAHVLRAWPDMQALVDATSQRDRKGRGRISTMSLYGKMSIMSMKGKEEAKVKHSLEELVAKLSDVYMRIEQVKHRENGQLVASRTIALNDVEKVEQLFDYHSSSLPLELASTDTLESRSESQWKALLKKWEASATIIDLRGGGMAARAFKSSGYRFSNEDGWMMLGEDGMEFTPNHVEGLVKDLMDDDGITYCHGLVLRLQDGEAYEMGEGESLDVMGISASIAVEEEDSDGDREWGSLHSLDAQLRHLDLMQRVLRSRLKLDNKENHSDQM